jgi:uncharacterized protein (TIGR00251 family)
MNLPGFLREHADGVVLSIKLQPRAASNEIGDALGNELRVKVTSPPVDAAANEALIRLLAKKLDCPRNRVELLRGETSRHKLIKIFGIPTEAVLQKLQLSLSGVS